MQLHSESFEIPLAINYWGYYLFLVFLFFVFVCKYNSDQFNNSKYYPKSFLWLPKQAAGCLLLCELFHWLLHIYQISWLRIWGWIHRLPVVPLYTFNENDFNKFKTDANSFDDLYETNKSHLIKIIKISLIKNNFRKRGILKIKKLKSARFHVI